LFKKVGLLETEVVKSVLVVGYEGSRSRKAIAFISDRLDRIARNNPKPQMSFPTITTSLLRQFKLEIEHAVISPFGK
jgi:hypothetical protein